jgi:hypothetical protein
LPGESVVEGYVDSLNATAIARDPITTDRQLTPRHPVIVGGIEDVAVERQRRQRNAFSGPKQRCALPPASSGPTGLRGI